MTQKQTPSQTTRRSRKPAASQQALAPVTVQPMLKIAESSLRSYGEEVVLNRAVPDFRDGLKPVHRCILWALYRLGLKNTGPFKKSARTVGEVIGKYHPHGDCLRGDTLVPLLNGECKSIKELAQRPTEQWVLSLNEKTGRLQPAIANAWRVGQRTSTMFRIHMSTGEFLECTGNHPVYVIGEGWVAASELEGGEVLAGGTLDYSKEYATVGTNLSSSSVSLHSLVATHAYGRRNKSEVFHHIDENTHNNLPNNLKKISRSEHAETHGDFLEGLAKGRARMFEGNTEYRKAIRKKNSALFRAFNQSLWLIKAVKAINKLRESGRKLTPANYERLRGRTYNLTKLPTLEKRGVSFEKLCAMAPTFVLDTSRAKGHTEHLRRRSRVTRVCSCKRVSPHLMLAASTVLERLTEHSALADLTWKEYSREARCLAKGNRSKVAYAEVSKVRREFKCRTVEDLANRLPGSYLSVVDYVEVVSLNKPEDFYDFTVDGLANMVVYTSSGLEKGNFLVVHNSGTYDAMVGMAGTRNDKSDEWASRNLPVPLIEGFGNWGDNLDPAAAMRYTEARLSKFSCLFMLDPAYLAVTDYLPNYSNDEQLPVVLPAKLPVLLLNGSLSIAFGISAECPSFAPEGVVKAVVHALQRPLTAKDCLRYLEFSFAYGGECVSTPKEKFAFFNGGKGSLAFRPTIEISQGGKGVSITSAAPGLVSKTSWSTLSKKLLTYGEVQSVRDVTDKKGFMFEVVCSRGTTPQQLLTIVEKETTRVASYDIGVTIRSKEGIKFRRMSVAALIQEWCKWRIELEVKVLRHLIKQEQQKLARLELTLLAVTHLDVIIAALRAKDSVAHLMKHLRVSEEEANTILDLKVRQLKSLEASVLRGSIKKVQDHIMQLQSDAKAPAKRIVLDLKSVETKAF